MDIDLISKVIREKYGIENRVVKILSQVLEMYMMFI